MSNYNSNQASPTEAPPTKTIRFDRGYVQSLPGILKVGQIVCNIVGFICIKVSSVWIASIFYNILYWFATVVSAFILLMYTLHVVEKYDRLPWHKVEFFYCSVVVLTYFGCSVFAWTVGESAGYATGFFGFCAMIAYGFDAYLKFKGWQRGLPPQ